MCTVAACGGSCIPALSASLTSAFNVGATTPLGDDGAPRTDVLEGRTDVSGVEDGATCCPRHDFFTICQACGHRGQYCFADPLGRKAEACLERVLEWIEAHAMDGTVFKTVDVWHGSVCSHYGMCNRVLRWLQYLGMITRMPGPPQAGNRWKVSNGSHT